MRKVFVFFVFFLLTSLLVACNCTKKKDANICPGQDCDAVCLDTNSEDINAGDGNNHNSD